MKQHKKKIIAGVIIVLVLAFTYWWGGNSKVLHGWKVDTPPASQNTSSSAPEETTQKPKLTADEKIEKAAEIAAEKESAGKGEPKQENEQEAETAQTVPASQKELSSLSDSEQAQENVCTLSIRCDTILNNLDYLNPQKQDIIPSNGIILAPVSAEFEEGDSVFDLLLKITRDKKIHMEYSSTPVYNSTYIEGIANLYEFDCGELSGWMYRVNGEYPNYGCSKYKLKSGDKVEWIYTCDLGVDVGGFNASLNN